MCGSRQISYTYVVVQCSKNSPLNTMLWSKNYLRLKFTQLKSNFALEDCYMCSVKKYFPVLYNMVVHKITASFLIFSYRLHGSASLIQGTNGTLLDPAKNGNPVLLSCMCTTILVQIKEQEQWGLCPPIFQEGGLAHLIIIQLLIELFWTILATCSFNIIHCQVNQSCSPGLVPPIFFIFLLH